MALYENEITEGDKHFINKDYRNDIGTETQSLQVLEDIRKLVRGTTQENKESNEIYTKFNKICKLYFSN